MLNVSQSVKLELGLKQFATHFSHADPKTSDGANSPLKPDSAS